VNTGTLHDKLRLLTLFRLLVAVVFMVAVYLGIRVEVRFLPVEARELIHGAVFGLLFLCVVSAGLLERWRSLMRLTLLGYVHFVADSIFATALVVLTGGCDSVFTFFYSLTTINASVVLYRRGAFFAAMLNTIFLCAVAWGQLGMLGSVFSSMLSAGAVLGEAAPFIANFRSVLPALSLNILAFFGIAFLSSHLAEQMKQADVVAQRHQAGFEELTNLHENIVSSLENGLITVNEDRLVTYANSRAGRLLGHSRESFIGRPLAELFPDMGPVLENPDKAGRVHTETTIQMIGGRRTYLRWTISPLRSRDQNQVGQILLIFDISKLKEMEEEVARTDRLAALGRLAANIAHEIRNPLASMSGSIQLLADSLEVAGSEKRLMDIVVRETEHLNQWISDFLDYARPKDPVVEELDLGTIVREVVEILRFDERAGGVTMTQKTGDDSLLVGDRYRLRQVVWNLVLNAVEAVAGDGEVTVTVECPEERVVLTVADTGPGIPLDVRPKLFEPFFTTKPAGTGLGLAAVHRNVEEHRGHIHIESPEGGGTSVVVTLPRSPVDLTSQPDEPSPLRR